MWWFVCFWCHSSLRTVTCEMFWSLVRIFNSPYWAEFLHLILLLTIQCPKVREVDSQGEIDFYPLPQIYLKSSPLSILARLREWCILMYLVVGGGESLIPMAGTGDFTLHHGLNLFFKKTPFQTGGMRTDRIGSGIFLTKSPKILKMFFNKCETWDSKLGVAWRGLHAATAWHRVRHSPPKLGKLRKLFPPLPRKGRPWWLVFSAEGQLAHLADGNDLYMCIYVVGKPNQPLWQDGHYCPALPWDRKSLDGWAAASCF